MMSDLRDKKYFRLQITKRFLMAMDEIIGRKGGEKVTAEAFGEVVGIASSNLSRIRSNPGDNFVTIEACGRICQAYNISPGWLILNQGPMISAGKKLTPLEMIKEAVSILESKQKK